MKLSGVGDPMVGMQRGQAGLLVDVIKRPIGLIRQDIGLHHLGSQALGRQKGSGSLDRRRGVVDADHLEPSPGEFDHFPASAAARNGNPAWLQGAAF